MPKGHGHSDAFRKVLRAFALFGHPLRVVIFQRLARRPSSAGELARELPISRTAVVQHVKLLEAGGMLSAARLGKRQIYSIDTEGLAPLARWVLEYCRISPVVGTGAIDRNQFDKRRVRAKSLVVVRSS